jgi:hypothetical protein
MTLFSRDGACCDTRRAVAATLCARTNPKRDANDWEL